MKKNEFFEWIKRFDSEEEKKLKKRTKALVENQRVFIKAVVNKIRIWKDTSKKSRKTFQNLLKGIRQKEGRNFTVGDLTDAISNRLKPFLYRFIITNETEQDELLKYQIIFKAAQKRHFSDAYFYYLDHRENSNQQQSHRSFNYFEEKSDINYLRYFNSEFQKYTFKTTQNYSDFKPEQVLYQTWQDSKTAFLIKHFRLACEILCLQSVVQEEEKQLETIDLSFLNQLFSDNDLSESIALQIYASLYQTFDVGNFENIEILRPIIQKALDNISIFTNEEQTSILILLLNIVGRVKKINPTEEVFSLLEKIAVFGFEKDIFGKEASIEENLYINLFSILQKQPLGKKLRNDFLHLLPTDNDRNWIKTYFDIQDCIENKEYYNTLILLKTLNNHNNFRFTLRKYILQLQCTLELQLKIDDNPNDYFHEQADAASDDRFQEILTNIDNALNYTKYLKKPTKDERQNFMNFVEITTMLFQKQLDTAEITIRLATDKAFAKDWLQKKFKQIKEVKKLKAAKVMI